jgi:hypothetical protein
MGKKLGIILIVFYLAISSFLLWAGFDQQDIYCFIGAGLTFVCFIVAISMTIYFWRKAN